MKNYAPQLSRKQFRAICDAHDIPAVDRPALAGLVYHGKPVGYPLHDKIDGRWRRSRKNGEYARFMVAILQGAVRALRTPVPTEGLPSTEGLPIRVSPLRNRPLVVAD